MKKFISFLALLGLFVSFGIGAKELEAQKSFARKPASVGAFCSGYEIGQKDTAENSDNVLKMLDSICAPKGAFSIVPYRSTSGVIIGFQIFCACK